MVSVDAAPTLIRLAREADPTGSYIQTDTAALPFLPESFDLVVFYNSLMDVDDMHGSIREAAGVLRQGGAMCACVTHPIADAGRFESSQGDAPFLIEGSYLGERRWTDLEMERDGLRMRFKGWAYSLEGYFRELEDSGFVIQAVREPRADQPKVDGAASDGRWHRIPIFLM